MGNEVGELWLAGRSVIGMQSIHGWDGFLRDAFFVRTNSQIPTVFNTFKHSISTTYTLWNFARHHGLIHRWLGHGFGLEPFGASAAPRHSRSSRRVSLDSVSSDIVLANASPDLHSLVIIDDTIWYRLTKFTYRIIYVQMHTRHGF